VTGSRLGQSFWKRPTMNMTLFGKILVLVNVALSIGFAAWAVAIYANRVDWGETREAAGKTKGKLLERKEELEDWKKTLDTAMQQYNAALGDLNKLEKKRPEEQKYYRDELAKLETGLDAQGKFAEIPVTELIYEKGQLKLDPKTLRPMQKLIDWQRPQQPLRDLAKLGKEFDNTHEELAKEKKAMDDLLSKEKELTERLNGDGKTKKGLRREMDEVQEAALHALGEKEFLRRMSKAGVNVSIPVSRGIDGEQEYLMPQLYNQKAELEIVLRRQRRMEARVQELKAVGATARQP
jgi:hypothetical protein